MSIKNYPESTMEGNEGKSGPITEQVLCDADVTQGSLTVPASLLERLTPGAALQADVQISVWNTEARERDAFRVETQVGGYATLPDGGIYSYSVDVE